MTAVLRAGRHRAAPKSLAVRLLGPVADVLLAELSYAWEWLLHGWPEPADRPKRAKLPVAIAPELHDPNYPAPRGGTLPDMPIPGFLTKGRS
jgi:hypothetical protein